MYIVMDPDGSFITLNAPVNSAVINSVVGEPGFDMVPLDPERTLCAFVNDDGFRLDLPRNIVGGAVCASLSGRPDILAGTIVVTGWDRHANGPEIRDLTMEQALRVTRIHDDVKAALRGKEISYVGAENWSDRIRAYAEHVRTADTPQQVVVTLDEYLAGREG